MSVLTSLMEQKQAWEAGSVILHHSDTVPGLSFCPYSQKGIQNLASIKGRSTKKPCLSLVSSYQMALDWWAKLPEPAMQTLKEVWPSSTTILWQAAEKAPKILVGATGEIGFRFPAKWVDPALKDFIDLLGVPFASTSVNLAGEPACTELSQAIEFAHRYPAVDFYEGLLSLDASFEATQRKPSKIIRLLENGDYQTIRDS